MVAVTIPLAILGLIIYAYWIWNKCSLAFPFTIIFLIEIAWGILSIIWIDSGIYITEQLRDSYTTGAAIRYILLMLPFALVFPYTLQKKILRKQYKTVKFEIPGVSLDSIIWNLCLISVGYIFLDLMISGIPLLSSSVNKIDYYTKFSKLPLASTLHNFIMPFAMLLSGIRFSRSMRKSKEYYKSLAVAGSIMVIQILMDNKFYGLYDYAIWFSIPVIGTYIKKKIDEKRVAKIPFKYIFITLVILGILLGICYKQYARLNTDPFAALLNRIFSLQSHTFWGIDLLAQKGKLSFDFDWICKEVLAGISGTSLTNGDFGIGRVMYLVTKSTYAYDMLRSGVQFAGSFLTVSLSYAGYIVTFAYSFIIGYITASICAVFYTYLKGKDLVMLFFCFLLYRRMYEYFRVGNLSIILSWKMVILFIILFGSTKIVLGRRTQVETTI